MIGFIQDIWTVPHSSCCLFFPCATTLILVLAQSPFENFCWVDSTLLTWQITNLPIFFWINCSIWSWSQPEGYQGTYSMQLGWLKLSVNFCWAKKSDCRSETWLLQVMGRQNASDPPSFLIIISFSMTVSSGPLLLSSPVFCSSRGKGSYCFKYL